MRIKPTALLALLPLLGACEVQSNIQGKYVAQQNDCRDVAEDRMDKAPPSASVKQRNAQLVDYFSACMIKAGWHVARPVKNPTPGTQTSNTPAQPLPGQPSDVITAGARVSSPSGEPVKTENSTLQPSASTPALNMPNISAPAQYQPARDYSMPPSSTTAPGRHF